MLLFYYARALLRNGSYTYGYGHGNLNHTFRVHAQTKRYSVHIISRVQALLVSVEEE